MFCSLSLYCFIHLIPQIIVTATIDQEYDIIDNNYNTIDVDICQLSNNTVCMEGEYISVEPDGHLTTNIN
jgi:hypothetical protein